MKLPRLNLTAPPTIEEPTLLTQWLVCGQETGVYVSEEYHVALKFVESCNKIGTYDAAFTACNATRQDVPGDNYYQVHNWELNSETLYANDTVPQPLLDCLYKEIPGAISSNNHSNGILIGEIIGGIAGAALVAAAVLCCCCRIKRIRRAPRNTVRREQEFQQSYGLGNSFNTFARPIGDMPPVQVSDIYREKKEKRGGMGLAVPEPAAFRNIY